ncbi:MAG: hypothetical protein K6357_07870 [Elusimicrobiota bacterium]
MDFAFNTPRKDGLSIEFQGGEQSLNWEVLNKTIIYAREKEKSLRSP